MDERNEYTREELVEALRALESTISKCEKVFPKLPEGKSQHTLLKRRLKALYISVDLIQREMERAGFSVDTRKFSTHITLGREIVTDLNP